MEESEEASAGVAAFLAATLTDHTALGDAESPESIAKLCAEAVAWPRAAAVCVWPRFVGHAKRAIFETCAAKGHIPRVATVLNFPGGTDLPSTVRAEAIEAVMKGAEEVDVVIDYKAFQRDVKEASAATVELVSTVKEARRCTFHGATPRVYASVCFAAFVEQSQNPCRRADFPLDDYSSHM